MSDAAKIGSTPTILVTGCDRISGGIDRVSSRRLAA